MKFYPFDGMLLDDAIEVTLPYPPSCNRYWRKFRGIMVTSEAARQYKRDAAGVLSVCQCEPIVGAVMVCMDVYRPQRRGDLDNSIKVLLDSLNGIAYDDDSQIVELRARRFDDKANPRVEVLIVPWEVVEP